MVIGHNQSRASATRRPRCARSLDSARLRSKCLAPNSWVRTVTHDYARGQLSLDAFERSFKTWHRSGISTLAVDLLFFDSVFYGHRDAERSTRYCWTPFTIDQSNPNDSHQSWSKLQTLTLYSRDYRPLESDGNEWRNRNEAIKHTIAQWHRNNLIQYYVYICICDINYFVYLFLKLYAYSRLIRCKILRLEEKQWNRNDNIIQ